MESNKTKKCHWEREYNFEFVCFFFFFVYYFIIFLLQNDDAMTSLNKKFYKFKNK